MTMFRIQWLDWEGNPLDRHIVNVRDMDAAITRACNLLKRGSTASGAKHAYGFHVQKVKVSHGS